MSVTDLIAVAMMIYWLRDRFNQGDNRHQPYPYGPYPVPPLGRPPRYGRCSMCEAGSQQPHHHGREGDGTGCRPYDLRGFEMHDFPGSPFHPSYDDQEAERFLRRVRAQWGRYPRQRPGEQNGHDQVRAEAQAQGPAYPDVQAEGHGNARPHPSAESHNGAGDHANDNAGEGSQHAQNPGWNR